MRPTRYVVLLAAIVAAAGCGQDSLPLPVVGTLERERIELVAESNEPIIAIHAKEGDRLEQDAPIIDLDPAVAQAELAEAEATRDEATARLAELRRGPRVERIAEARARAEGAAENLVATAREYERVRELVDQKLLSPSELDHAYSAKVLAESEREQARAVLTELENGTTDEELAQAEAAVANAMARVERTATHVRRLTVRAPRAGRLDALPYELGERPPTGAIIAVMLAEAAPYARVFIPEPIRARVTPGMRAVVRVDGTDRAYTGKVRFVAADASYTPYYALTQRDRSRLSYAAEIDLTEDAARELPTGVPVEVDLPDLR